MLGAHLADLVLTSSWTSILGRLPDLVCLSPAVSSVHWWRMREEVPSVLSCVYTCIIVIVINIIIITVPTFLQYLQQTKGTSTESSVILRNFSQTGEWVVDSSNVILSESAWIS